MAFAASVVQINVGDEEAKEEDDGRLRPSEQEKVPGPIQHSPSELDEVASEYAARKADDLSELSLEG